MNKTDTLYFRQNLSSGTIAVMKNFRKLFIMLSNSIELLGESRELSLAFTHLEQSQFYVNKFLCLIDPQATKEEIE